MEYLPEVRPEWFFAVPRIWEKLKAGLETMIAAQPEEAQAKANAALDAAIQKVRLEQKGEPVPEELAATVAKADEEMFQHLRKQLGLDRVVTINVGAAPTPVEVLEFFHAIGLELAELWGMSETSGGATCNPPGKVKIGTVGPAAARCGDQARRGRRGARAGARPTWWATATSPRRPPRRSTPTAGSTRATSARSTTTAISRSSTARRS